MASTEKIQLVEDTKKYFNRFYRWILSYPNKIKIPLLILLIILPGTVGYFLLYGTPQGIRDLYNSRPKLKQSDNDKKPKDSILTKPPSETPIPFTTPSLLGCASNKNWIPFTSEYWDGLKSRFQKIGDVFTLPDPVKKVDTVAYFKNSCLGSFTAEIVFIPESQTLINLNLYYGSWFRWEIGGNDLNSVKLYKNIEGCTAIKAVRQVNTKNKYLPDGEKIMTGKPVIAKFSVFLSNGKLKTTIDLHFTSSNSGREIDVRDWFYHDFDIDQRCDSNTVLNIENDSERVGVGLMRSSNPNAEIPKINLQKFRVYPYGEQVNN